MKKTPILIFVLILLLSSVVSAFDFDNIKKFEPNPIPYGTIEVKNAFGLGETLGQYQLLENTNVCGEHCYAEGTATLNSNDRLFTDINFYDQSDNLKSLSFNVYIQKQGVKSVDDTELQCDTALNGSQTDCELVVVGSHLEDYNYWEAYDGSVLEAGDYTWRVEATKNVEDNIDWVATAFGKQLNEWAWWNGSEVLTNKAYLEEGLISWWNMNETSGSTAEDLIQPAQNGTIYGMAFNSSGIFAGCFDYEYSEGDYLNITEFDLSGQSVTALSVGGWYKSESIQTHNPLFDARGGGGNGNIRFKGDSSGNIIMQMLDTGIGAHACTTDSVILKTNKWVHVIATWDQSTTKIYVDGVLNKTCGSMNFDLLEPTSAELGQNVAHNGRFFDGLMDEVAFWNKTLNATEVSDLYNNGVGITYTATPVGGIPVIANLTVNSSSTQNYANGSVSVSWDYDANGGGNQTMNETRWFKNNVLQSSLTNLSTVEAGNISRNEVWKASVRAFNGINWSLWYNETETIANYPPNTPTTRTPNADINYIHNTSIPLTCSGASDDVDTGDTFSYEFWIGDNNLTIRQNTSATSYTYTFDGGNGTYLFNCRANDNASNSPFFASNISIKYNSSTVLDWQEAHATNGQALTKQNYYFNLTYDPRSVSDLNAKAIINTTIYTPTETNHTNKTSWNASKIIGASETFDFIKWNITIKLVNGSIIYKLYQNGWNETYTPITLNSSCSGSTPTVWKIVNLTFLDEEELTSMNSDLEIAWTIWTYGAGAIYNGTFQTDLENITNTSICLDALATGDYYIANAEFRYTANDYVVRNYYFRNQQLVNTSVYNLNLYNLLSNLSTSFLVTYKDDSYLPVEDAILDLWRFYVGDGVWRSIEKAQTDQNGQTRLHMITEDVKYKILVREDGVLDYTTPDFLAICQATPCLINIQKESDISDIVDVTTIDNVDYSWTLDRATRTVDFLFSTQDGSTSTFVMNVTKWDGYKNNTICDDSLSASGGTLSCTIPLTAENVTYIAEIYQDGSEIGNRVFSLENEAYEFFGGTGVLLSVFLILTLVLMAITSGIFMVVMAIIGVIVAGLLTLINTGNIIGVGSAIMWLIVAGVIIIVKIAKRRVQ